MPSPAPIPQPSDVSPITTEAQRAGKIKNLKYGVLSTIKTTPQGAIGTGPELNTAAARGGAALMFDSGTKKTLGS
jgi:hypothetical protein